MYVLTILFSLLSDVTQSSTVPGGVTEVLETFHQAREGVYEARSELETSLVETLSLVRSQATESTIYLQEIRNTLNSVTGRLNKLEKSFESLEDKVGANAVVATTIKERLGTLEGLLEIGIAKTDAVKDQVDSNGNRITRVQSRQEVVMSEVRLISLYKMTDQTSTYGTHGGSFGSDLAVDGQFVFSKWDPAGTIRTIAHTANCQPDDKLWIDLGGLFRIHRVKIWNSRHYGPERFIGTHIYADERIIGVAVDTKWIYDFVVPAEYPAYAKTITLHQELAHCFHVLEVQVWGTGPFSKDDLFA